MAWVGVGFFALASVSAVVRLRYPTRMWARALGYLLWSGAVPFVVIMGVHGIQSAQVPAFGRFEALTIYGLAILLAYVLAAARTHRLQATAAVLVPFVSILLFCAAVSLGTRTAVPANLATAWLGLHVLTAFVGYGLCTLAGVLGLAYLVQDRNLKRRHLGVVFDSLPALETLDHLMAVQVGAAFLMLTLSLAFGVHLVRLSGGGMEWARDPKIASTVATWAIYAVLMHMRTNARRHGKGMALIAVVGLCFVLFSFLGIHLLADSVHSSVLAGKGAP